jgi:hypothetical protein
MPKSIETSLRSCLMGNSRECADAPHPLGLLTARREQRPRCCAAANQGE